MTEQEFQDRYHDFETDSEAVATAEAMKVNEVLEVGGRGPVVPVRLGDRWCLMLKSAADLIREMGL